MVQAKVYSSDPTDYSITFYSTCFDEFRLLLVCKCYYTIYYDLKYNSKTISLTHLLFWVYIFEKKSHVSFKITQYLLRI